MSIPEKLPSRPAVGSSGWPRDVLWILAALSPLLGIFVALAGVLGGLTLLPKLCPPELLVSGACHAPWYRSAETAVLAVAFGAGAALFVGLPAILAPAGHRAVAATAFLCGLTFIGSLGFFVVPVPSVTAALVGALAAITVSRLRHGAA
jgi:hypothetical protein